MRVLWLCALLVGGGADASALQVGEEAAPGARVDARDTGPRTEDQLAALRELTELDLAAELVARFGPAVAAGGPLARSGEALALVARARFVTGDEDGARALLEAARPDAASAHLVLFARARLALELDRLDEAMAFLLERADGRTRARFPDEPEALLLLARILARRGDVRAAREPAERFLALAPLAPEAPTAWHIAFLAATERGERERAAECLRARDEARRWQDLMKVRRLQARAAPDDPLPRLGVALLWMEAQAFARAASELEALVRRWPDQPRAWFHLGECRRLLGDGASALGAYERALALDPAHAPATVNRAALLAASGRDEEASTALEAFVAGPDGGDARYAAAHLLLARLLHAAGAEQASAARYARYLELGGTEPL